MSPIVEYSVDAHVARVTLNRPEKRNALSAELIAELRAVMDRAAADPSVKVILLRGAGPDFCAGMDLKGLAQTDDSDVLTHLATARSLADLYLAMRNHPRPIVAAVQGRAIGGGCGLATASDLILAAESASLRYPEVNIGIVAAIVMAMLRRLVGEKRAFEITALGDEISARIAASLGLVNRIYADSEFDAAVEHFAAELAAKSSTAVTLTKQALYRMDAMSFEAALDTGVQINAIARMTPDAKRGVERFQKR